MIYMNPKAIVNRVFFAMCLSLSLWSLGFAVANFAPNLETCLVWRRVSALGWGSIYGIMLHFFLVITEHNFTLKWRKFYPVLYLPAVVAVYAFSFSTKITATQYNLVRMDYGWINIAVQNGWTFFFQSYYAGYGLASLALLWLWKRRAANPLDRKKATLILISVAAALLLGSATDVVLSSKLAGPLPQMAPIFILIPVAALYYSIKRYRLMGEIAENNDELILSSESRSKLYLYLSYMFLAGGLMTSLVYFFPHMAQNEEALQSMLFASGAFFLLGIVILLLQLVKSDAVKDFVVLIMTLLSIPLIILRFVEYGGVTVWVFPFILMFLSLVFNSKLPLILVTSVSIITQVLVWMYAPKGMIQLDQFDYILRIGMFFIAFMIGLFVNKTYIKKLKENVRQMNFEKMVSEISSDFVSVSQQNIDEKINTMLNKIGCFFDVDRTCIVLFDDQDPTKADIYKWCCKENVPVVDAVLKVPSAELRKWMEGWNSGEPLFIEDVSKLPDGDGAGKEQLMQWGIQSAMVIPIEENGRPLGFMRLGSVMPCRKWPEHPVKLLKILTNLLADGLIKIKAAKEIEYMAYYDSLTGLPNRVLFSDRLTQAIHLARRTEGLIGVIFLDLDSFKMVNDTMGHSGGDALLQDVAQSLVQRLRKIDTVARFGGDEFLIMVHNISDHKNIIKIAGNILGLFESPFHINEQEFFITGSAGVAVYPFDGEDADTLIKNADIAMYTAKTRGKNQYALCTEDMKEQVRKNIRLSNHLYRVQQRNELVVYYQPQIRLHTGQIIGVEALLRWKHPELGMVPPNIFIPLAEMNGTINGIGEWILKTATQQNKKWQDIGLPHLRMAVNLSVIQLNNPRIVEMVDQTLKETGLSPKYLELEITESIAMKEAAYIVDILNRLKELGVSISIDDFGTEYSSLNRIKVLPIDRIKIDMQFVQGIEGSEKDQAITKVIINLAKSLGLEVLAEGVETAPQLEFLNQKMCDDVQGYYYYKPMPAEEMEALLRSCQQKGRQ
jgi:diguanylate cyclase (GGDEF)-like protein